MTNNTYLDNDNMMDPFFNESTIPPTQAPVHFLHGQNSSDVDVPERSASSMAVTYLFLLACLFIASLWTMYAARNYSSPRAGGDGDEEQSYKKLSVEDLHKMIAQKFDQLGNQATLTAESFRADDPPPREAQEIIKRDDSDTSDDESTADVDLEEGPADYDGHIVVNRTATDSLSEELAAPNCCAICLESYTCGEEVVWSANEKCHHIYHKDCIAAYFAHAKKKKSKKKCACPTCRQEFLVLDFPSETKGKADEERAQSETASTMEATWQARQERILGNRI